MWTPHNRGKNHAIVRASGVSCNVCCSLLKHSARKGKLRHTHQTSKSCDYGFQCSGAHRKLVVVIHTMQAAMYHLWCMLHIRQQFQCYTFSLFNECTCASPKIWCHCLCISIYTCMHVLCMWAVDDICVWLCCDVHVCDYARMLCGCRHPCAFV